MAEVCPSCGSSNWSFPRYKGGDRWECYDCGQLFYLVVPWRRLLWAWPLSAVVIIALSRIGYFICKDAPESMVAFQRFLLESLFLLPFLLFITFLFVNMANLPVPAEQLENTRSLVKRFWRQSALLAPWLLILVGGLAIFFWHSFKSPFRGEW